MSAEPLPTTRSHRAAPEHPVDTPRVVGQRGHHPPPQITVASVPAGHVYVRHIAAERPDGVVRLPDPDPDDAARQAEQRWWPPAMLDPGWISTHDFDLFHVHFGFDAWRPEELEEVVDALRAAGRPLVHTVHDLRNPHHGSRTLHDAQLGVLLARADAVLTLTDGAAREVEERFGRVVDAVVPHPHVVELDEMERRAAVPRVDGPFRVGLHVKSLRPSMDPLAMLPTLCATVAELPDAVLQVNGHRDVLEPGGARYDAALAEALREAEAQGRLELHVHDFLPDDDLWDLLSLLDVSVLPYRFGTHSGWLEACRDLGTAVVAPTCGYYAEQGPVHSFLMDEGHFEAATLRRALHDAHDAHVAGEMAAIGADVRRDQRAAVAARHRRLYERLR